MLSDLPLPVFTDHIPPYLEGYAAQVLAVAETYRIAEVEQHKKIKYVHNGHSFLSRDNDGVCYPIFDEDGYALIDCSTFIHLVLRGIRYEDSPYATLIPATAVNYDCNSLLTNTIFRWADDSIRGSWTMDNTFFKDRPDGSNTIGLPMVRYAADLGKYFVSAGRAFPYTEENLTLLKPGDLVFYWKSDMTNRFMRINHVGIVTERTDRMYNVISREYDPDAPYYVAYSSIIQTNRNIAFFARPDYAKIARGSNGFSGPSNNFLPSPWSLTPTANDDAVTAVPDTQAGTVWTKAGVDPTAGTFRVIYLADANHPIYLPSGVYKLTGAPAHPDRRANYYGYFWGIRVYFPVLQDMAYTTFGYPNSSGSGDVSARSVAETDEVKRVWDRGYGAIFTLEEGAWMYADIYVSVKAVSDSEPYANECPTEDIWKPSLVRIGDAPSNRGTRAPLPENA